MFRLSIYELRKNRNALLILIGVLAACELYFLYGVFWKEEHTAMASVLLVLFSFVCFVAVFLIAMMNYYREMNSKTSYLVFMTPISPEKIILSKMLTVLLIGIILVSAIAAMAALDVGLMFSKYDAYQELIDDMMSLLQRFGVNTAEILASVFFSAVVFLLSFFSSVALIYLCITAASTLLQNSRLKAVITVVFFIAAFWGKGKLSELIDAHFTVVYGETVYSVLLQSWPYTLFNAAVFAICVLLTALLLRKKLSL